MHYPDLDMEEVLAVEEVLPVPVMPTMEEIQQWDYKCARFMCISCCAICARCAFNSGSRQSTWRAIRPPNVEQFTSYIAECPALHGNADVDLSNVQPPAGLVHPHLAGFMQTAEGKWHICPTCGRGLDARKKQLKFHPWLPAGYLENLLAAPPLEAQLMSIVDIGLQLNHQGGPTRNCFSRLEVVHKSLFDCIVVYSDAFRLTCQHTIASVSNPVQEIYAINAAINPLFERFIPILERPSAQPGLPSAAFPLAQALIQKSRAAAPIDLPAAIPGELNVLLRTHQDVGHLTPQSLMDIGELLPRANPQQSEPLVCMSNGQAPPGDPVSTPVISVIAL
jgi:hypothetical protein